MKTQLFLIPSVFTKFGFCSRSLILSELFALWDIPQSVFKSLSRPQHLLFWKRNSIPPRALRFLLRMFLSCKNVTEGIGLNIGNVVEEDGATIEGGSKHVFVGDDCQSRKRVKTSTLFHNEELEVKFRQLSGDMSVLREKKLRHVKVSKKRDDAPVPTELWLF